MYIIRYVTLRVTALSLPPSPPPLPSPRIPMPILHKAGHDLLHLVLLLYLLDEELVMLIDQLAMQQQMVEMR